VSWLWLSRLVLICQLLLHSNLPAALLMCLPMFPEGPSIKVLMANDCTACSFSLPLLGLPMSLSCLPETNCIVKHGHGAGQQWRRLTVMLDCVLIGIRARNHLQYHIFRSSVPFSTSCFSLTQQRGDDWQQHSSCTCFQLCTQTCLCAVPHLFCLSCVPPRLPVNAKCMYSPASLSNSF